MDFIKKILMENGKFIFPVNDKQAYLKYPDEKIIYNKLLLSDIQNLNCNPIPIIPSIFPIIIKPIINLDGMSKGFKKIDNKEEYIKYNYENNLAGYFYQKYLPGVQLNFDIIFRNGKIIDYFCLKSYPLTNGMFKYHEFFKDGILSKKNIEILESILYNYTGFCNIEVIDDYMIEAHLRLNCDMFIYNENDLTKLVHFYKTSEYDKIIIPEKIYFVPFFFKGGYLDKFIIENYLNDYKKFIIDFKFNDINSTSQSIDKRFLCITTNNLDKILELKNIIYKKFNIDYNIYG
jgi:hypothetical protein